MNGGQIIVDYLIQEKVPYIFGLCGHGNISFLDALHERSDEIKTLSVRHESLSGFMADVYYRVAGKPVATFTSCGPGSANMPISLANAFFDSVPFLAVTGNIPTNQFNRGAFQETYRHYQADFPSTVQAYCKRVYQPTRAEMVPQFTRQAWKTMMTGRRGPVVLDVPFDVFKEETEVDMPQASEWNANISCRCGADPEGVKKAVQMLSDRRAARDPGGPGREVRGRGGEDGRARREAEHSRRVLIERDGGGRRDSSPGPGPHRQKRDLSCEPRRAPGGRSARARRSLRRSHLEQLAARLFVQHPAHEAHPRGYRPGRNRAELPGGLRPHGGRGRLSGSGS